MEYFVDVDPGLGKANTIAYNYTKNIDSIEASFEFPVKNLSIGLHQLHVRYADSNGNWSPWGIHNFLIEDTIKAEVIEKLEYFIDSDPSLGKGINLNITIDTIVSKQFTHSINGLSTGRHYLHIRNKLSHGLWSPWQMHLFDIEDTVKNGHITNLEYFIGDEPRLGKGVSLNIIPADSVKSEFNTSVSNLKQGQNFIHVRSKIDKGLWSPWQMQMFYIDDTISIGTIQEIEYFVGKEPRPGKGISLNVTPSDSIKKEFQHAITNLKAGQNFIHVRNKTNKGLWSPWQMQMFYIDDTIYSGPIQELEYFIDKEPRPGKGNKISFNPADTIQKLFTNACTGLKSGQHFIHIRNKIAVGLWSPWQMQMFYIQDTLLKKSIISYSYSIDTGLLSINDTSTFKLNIATDSFKRIHYSKTDTSLNFGNHLFRIWVQQNNNISSVWHFDTFTVIDCPMLDTADIKIIGGICKGDTFIFKQNITQLGKWPSDSFNFKWYLNGNSNPSSLIDSLKTTGNGADSFQLRFTFSRKTEARCKGEYNKMFHLKPNYFSKDTFYICYGDSVKAHGKTFKNSGVFTTQLSSLFSCDSTIESRVITFPNYSKKDTLIICQGDSIVKHGTVFKNAGTFNNSFFSKNGCDSSIQTVVKINQKYAVNDTITLCGGDSLIMHGRTFKSIGTYKTNFKTKAGCDSIFLTTVSVNPSYQVIDTFTICEGDSVSVHGKTHKTAGTYLNSYKTIKGCDSLFTTLIHVNPVYQFNDTFEICSGDSIQAHGKTFMISGDFRTDFKSSTFCDSVYSTHVIVHPSYLFQDSFYICSGDTITVHGKTLSNAGEYKTIFSTYNGCDSVYYTYLQVYPKYKKVRTIGLCGGDSILFESTYKNKTGIYTINYQTINGCDSSYTLILTVDSVINSESFIEICQGDSIELNGQFEKAAGDYFEKYTAIKGCDSIVSIHLSIRKNDSTYLRDTFCFGNTYTFFNQSITKSGRYDAILKNQFGCDSVIILDAFEMPQMITQTQGSVCFGDSAFIGKSYKKGAGVFRDTFITAKGCDSIIIYTQTERPKLTSTLNISICTGDSVLTGNSYKKLDGDYIDTVQTRFGCDSIVFTKINIKPNSKTVLIDSICFGTAYSFFGNTLTSSGTYTHLLSNFRGCDSIIELHLFRHKQYIPKVISLNFSNLSADTIYASYQWYLDRTILPGDTFKTIAVNREGVYDISVSDHFGCIAKSWDDQVGLNTYAFNGLKIYPNPNGGIFYIDSETPFNVSVYSAFGAKILNHSLESGKQMLDLTNYSDGMYWIYIQTSNTFLRYKILILR